jgi:hypothetical protein
LAGSNSAVSDLTSTFDRNFYQEVRGGYRGVLGQDVGQLHLEAPFGDRALLLEFESGFFASREGPAGARYIRDAAAGADRYSAETTSRSS